MTIKASKFSLSECIKACYVCLKRSDDYWIIYPYRDCLEFVIACDECKKTFKK